MEQMKAAREAKIPFVLASGGNSLWSTINEGMVMDLSYYKGVFVDATSRTAIVRGGALMKDLQVALSEKGQFTAVANSSSVGAIPYMIGGGISSYTPLIGYACENILAARIILSSGDIVVATEAQHRDLLWAVRGAGQFFGIVIELVVRTYSFSLIGPKGERQLGVIFFAPERAAEVCRALKAVLAAPKHVSSGHLMVMKDQSWTGRMLLLAPEYFGTLAGLKDVFKPLLDLGPLYQEYQPSTFEKHSEHLAWMCGKGDYKRLSQIGLTDINPENFAALVRLHAELLDTVPGTERSVFTIEWHTPTPKAGARETDTCFGLKDTNVWLTVLTWYVDSNLRKDTLSFDQRAQAIMRQGMQPEAYITYTNTSRHDPIEHRYPDPAALQKLRALKRMWDPKGVFTRELL